VADIDITRRHSLGREKARAEAEALAQTLKERLNADYAWEGDFLRFSRSGASGFLRVNDEEIQVNVKLGLAFRVMRGTIEGKVNSFLDEKLGKA